MFATLNRASQVFLPDLVIYTHERRGPTSRMTRDSEAFLPMLQEKIDH
jgi:hypothetical protein